MSFEAQARQKMVLPEGIELSTSPFITLTLSCPALPHAREPFVRWTIPSPWASPPLDATRLVSTPSLTACRRGLGSGLPLAGRLLGEAGRFPRIWAVISRSCPAGQANTYQGSALPLSYGSFRSCRITIYGTERLVAVYCHSGPRDARNVNAALFVLVTFWEHVYPLPHDEEPWGARALLQRV